MLDIRSVSKSFDDIVVLENISLSLHREVVALVGHNGSGKSTLCQIITGEMEPDSGSVSTNETIGYLPQHFDFGDMTVSQFLANGKEEYEVDVVLGELGILHVNREQLASSLSGGEKTKLYLAKLLLAEARPTFLLLDEPTNNLDLDGVLWLEEFISNFDGTVFLTSHDRALLDEVVDRIVELDKGKVKQYGGNYSFYLEQKTVARQAYERKYLAQEKKIEQIEADINVIQSKTVAGEAKFSSRNPYQRRKIRKAAQTGVVRKKKLEKFLASEERLVKPLDRRNYPFQFVGSVHSDKFLVGMKGVSKRYGATEVLRDASFAVQGAQHVWISGANGSGKSTVVKLLVGQEQADSGSVEIGSGVKVGYFSQEIVVEGRGSTMLAELTALGATSTDVYRYAKFLHFESDDVTKPLSGLSRGQLTKVEFIKLLMSNYSLLVLDEPTNHLEIDTREQIEEALRYYEGAIVVVSHDRYFLEEIGIDRELTVRDGEVVEVY